jgi:hypothetical protein
LGGNVPRSKPVFLVDPLLHQLRRWGDWVSHRMADHRSV